jgi:hypothetical protein
MDIPPLTGREARDATLGLLPTRAFALSLAGQITSRDSLCNGMAEHSLDFLSDLPRSAARRVPLSG